MYCTSLQRVRAFSGSPTTSVAATPCRTRVVRAQIQYAKKPEHTSTSVEPSPSASLPIALSVALGALAASASRALAVEAVSVTVASGVPAISPEDAEVLAASSSGGGIEAFLVPLLFGVVVLLLTIVTGGVAYINIKQWLDSRQETEDRQREGKAPAGAAGSAAAKAGGDDDEGGDGEVVVPLRRASRIKKEKGKGFASSEFTSRR